MPLTNAEKQATYRSRQSAKLARFALMQAALVEIGALVKDRPSPLSAQVRELVAKGLGE